MSKGSFTNTRRVLLEVGGVCCCCCEALVRVFVSPPPAAFLTQTVNLDDTTVKFEIWDTAGQERYHSLAPMYYRGAQAAIVVYDITNQVRATLHSIVSIFITHTAVRIITVRSVIGHFLFKTLKWPFTLLYCQTKRLVDFMFVPYLLFIPISRPLTVNRVAL